MARSTIMAAAAASLPLLLAFGQNPTPSKGAPSVGVFLDFDTAPGPVAFETMKSEADQILKPAGVALDWRMASEAHGQEAFAGVVVLKFRGKCRVEAWSAPSADLASLGETKPLGATKVANGRVLPFTEVECDQVKQALAYLQPDQKDRQRAFGIALGRVVAHELYHVLAHTTVHAASGLARATESLEDLVSPRAMTFRAEDATAIRQGLIGQ